MRKTDISKYTEKIDVSKKPVCAKNFLGGFGKIILTIIGVLVCTGLIISISLGIYVFKVANEPTGIDLNARSLNLSSFIYIEDPDTKEFVEYQTLYGTENRVWVNLSDMPKYMPDAIVAIEDKRFYKHHGVDWFRTGSAILSLVSGSDNYGGSTLTQQLIKNITDDNEVSLKRKLREIFKAINIEKEYSKDDIIEAYLNVVNFGNNAQGVETAAELYFDKSIDQCSICECAAIAGITQNPAKWNPLVYPENNKIRREIVLDQMYEQEMITKAEYEEAIKESETLTFVDTSAKDEEEEDEDDEVDIQNWYIDQMYGDLVRDLAKYYDISEDAASEKLYTEGLKIYCAMDLKAQEMIEEEARNDLTQYDSELQTGMEMIGFDGRVICTAGSTQEKDGNLLFDRASDAVLQPGSSIKGVMVYPLAMDSKIINYSSLVKDEPVENWKYENGVLKSGPNNAYGSYNGYMTVPEAIAWSSNAAAVQTMNLVGTENAYNHATANMGFKHLAQADSENLGALSIGGMEGGVTVREMAAAMEYVGNGGLYYEPYTYYYVTDQNDTVILDNRNNQPKEAYSEETAYAMNRLLRYNVLTSQHSASPYANIDGWEIVGKTGTTDDDKDIWFVGASPYCTLACWVGYDNPHTISQTSLAAITWQKVMSNYLSGKENKEYDVPSTIIPATYCKGSGLLAASYCGGTDTGYYTKDNMPEYCSGYHLASGGSVTPNYNDNTNSKSQDTAASSKSNDNTTSKSSNSEKVSTDTSEPSSDSIDNTSSESGDTSEVTSDAGDADHAAEE